MSTETGKEHREGVGVDSRGNSVVDPTENVKALMEASIKSLMERGDLQGKIVDEKVLRMERELVNQEKISILRADHNREVRHMESDRVDKIRSVDVANAAATAAQLLSAVTTLATTAQATAETLRNQVAATAAAVASQTERVVNPIIERIALLEKSSYTGAGKMAVSDPAMADLVSEVRKFTTATAVTTGKAEGLSMSAAILLGMVALISSLVGIGGVLYAVLKP